MNPTATSAFDWWTFGIAVAGATVAICALGWQIIAFVQSGSRVKVELAAGYLMFQAGHPPTPAVAVRARNVGRTAVNINSWSIALPDDNHLAMLDWDPTDGPPTPHRLDPGTSADWWMTSEKLRQGLEKGNLPLDTKVRARVSLGNGKIKTSPSRGAAAAT